MRKTIQTMNGKKSIFQTYWKDDCCTNFLFLELGTSNFSYVLSYFSISLKVPPLMFYDFVAYQKFKRSNIIVV